VGSVWSTVQIEVDANNIPRVRIINTNTVSQDDIDRAMNQ